MDQSGLFTMEDTLEELAKNGKTVLLIGLGSQPRYLLERVKVIPNLIHRDHIFEQFNDCHAWVKDHLTEFKNSN